jgi:hypothetical protein
VTAFQGRVSALQAARDYIARGWNVVPIPYRKKKPIFDDWHNLRIPSSELAEYFPGSLSNIGTLLGAPSRWLIDADLDHQLAVELAETHLPSTRSIFGREGKRRSHWLYYASSPVATRQWRLPDRSMVVELRSAGAQTVFPGSVHECGEPIEWELDGEPTTINPSELANALNEIYLKVCRSLGVQNTGHKTPIAADYHAPRSILERARKYLAKMPVAVSGQGGHNSTYHATCTLVLGFGLDRGDALTLLREWNENCQPPWSERELEHKVDSALKEPGWRGYLLGDGKRSRNISTSNAIERANRHAIEHRRKARRRAHG